MFLAALLTLCLTTATLFLYCVWYSWRNHGPNWDKLYADAQAGRKARKEHWKARDEMLKSR